MRFEEPQSIDLSETIAHLAGIYNLTSFPVAASSPLYSGANRQVAW